jgi:hypothetical protein
MSTVRLLAISIAILAMGSACVPAYRPPSASEPHAVVKLRRSYEGAAGESLRETVDINDHRAFEETSPAGVANAPRADSVLVHPEPATARFSSMFFHTQMRQVQERYTEQEPHYETERYDCSSGFGTNRVYRTCARSVTRYRPKTKYRWVTKAVEITDGECSSTVSFIPAEGHVYLLEYTYRDSGACAVSCYTQTPGGKEGFRNQPCAVGAQAR